MGMLVSFIVFFFSSRRRHTRYWRDWSSDVCSSDLEGMAQRASDIDVVWIYGYGWPVYRGGPMFWADTEGLPKIAEGIRRQQERLGAEFKLSDMLVQKAEAGEKFNQIGRAACRERV